MVASVVGHYRFVEFWSQKPSFFSYKAWVFFPNPLSFVGLESICWEKIAIFCSKFVQYEYMTFFCTLRHFTFVLGLFFGPNAENWMNLEIPATTFNTGSLSFSLKNPWVFWAVEFFRAWVFSKMLKKQVKLRLTTTSRATTALSKTGLF